MKPLLPSSIALAAALALLTTVRADDAAPFMAVAPNPSALTIADAAGPVFTIALAGWGPAWSWTGWDGQTTLDGGAGHSHLTAKLSTGATLTVELVTRLDAQGHLAMEGTLTSDKDTDLTLVCLALAPDATRYAGGSMISTTAAGAQPAVALPLGRPDPQTGVTALKYSAAAQPEITATFAAPASIQTDGASRVLFAEKHIGANQPAHVAFSITLPGKVNYYATAASAPDEPGIDKWYAFTPPATGKGENALSMATWLDAPAGKLGRIKDNGPDLIYGGKPIRLWGINLAYGACAPPKDLADRRADFYASNGINAVRLHKFADGTGWQGIQSNDSFTQFDAAGLDRMDYFVSKLKEKGIYVELSATFGVKPGPADLASVPFASELGPKPASGARVNSPTGSIYLSSELQDLMISQTKTLLAHKNPYTGMTYAADPGVAVIELFNEESSLFFGTMGVLQNVPTLRARTGKDFAQWLKTKYGTKDALTAAWGASGLNSFVTENFTGESWEDGVIYPAGNPWFYDPDQLAGAMAPRKQRLLDTMQYLYGLQNKFYDRYAQAIRDAGYTGELVASNWQAGRAISHFYNLHSDARIGIVDRHNYFDGLEASMLSTPGSGILGSGLSQVANRPFMLSEWISTFPSEFAVEAPAIIGAYGLGLQGWDVSFMFQNGDDGVVESVLGNQPWEVMTPQNISVFPAIARQVLRGDVKTSPLLAPRYVNLDELAKGQLGFDDRATQAGDVKSFTSATVPAASLAVARCVVDFTPQPKETPKFAPETYLKDGAYQSATGQLRWHPAPASQSHGGWFSMNTPGTQAAVGFVGGQKFDLADVVIQPTTNFTAIYVTAQERDHTLADTHAMLVTALGRVRNTGMKIDGGQMLDRGKGPILLEPVVATLTLKRVGTPIVHVLDQAGYMTAATLPVSNGQVQLDGARDKSPYYLITW